MAWIWQAQVACFVVLTCLQVAPSALAGEAARTVNGDVNGDGSRNISDASYLLNWLFLGGPPPLPVDCPTGDPDWENGDSNGDGESNISDASHLLNWLFLGGDSPVEIRCMPDGNLGVVRFIAIGNTGRGNTTQSEVAAAIEAKCALSGCDFVLLLGDNIYDSGVDSVEDSQWQTKFEIPYRDIDLDFFPVLGNHDYGGNGAGSDFPRGEFQVQYSQRSEKWNMPAKHYLFRREQVDFFMLDTNLQMYRMDAAQRTDVSGWIAGSTATWKIAVGHHPYLSNGPHGNAGEYDGLPFVPTANGAGVKAFMENVICGRVDLYLSAHDESLQWLEPTCQGTEFIVSGTGSNATTLIGSNSSRFQNAVPGFVYVIIEDKTLTAEFIDESGTVLFSHTVVKE